MNFNDPILHRSAIVAIGVLLSVAFSGCTEKEQTPMPALTPPTVPTQNANGTFQHGASASLVRSENFSYAGTTRAGNCIATAVGSPPCMETQTGKDDFHEVSPGNGIPIRIFGNISWKAESDFTKVLAVDLGYQDQDGLWVHMEGSEFQLRGENPLTFDWAIPPLSPGTHLALLVTATTESDSPLYSADVEMQQSFAVSGSLVVSPQSAETTA